jgi:UDP-N-acetylmuramate--alanine ligase
LLISKFGLGRTRDLKGARHLTYSVQNKNADAHADNVKMMNGSYEFDVIIKEKRIRNVSLNVGGMHNVENAIAAITVASSLNIDEEKIKAAVADFRGVKRRFEYIIKTDNLVFIDDYAHHPEELRALINGAKSLFSDKPCTVIFQPHLYTRTRDLADGFAEVLDMADEVVLLPVYPARELPIAGVSSEMILSKMKNKNKMVLNKEELKAWIEKEFKKQGKVIVTAGAGDIDLLVEPIKQILK